MGLRTFTRLDASQGKWAKITTFLVYLGGYQGDLYGQSNITHGPKRLSTQAGRGGAWATIVTQKLPAHYSRRR
jgi:hypothetical protein